MLAPKNNTWSGKTILIKSGLSGVWQIHSFPIAKWIILAVSQKIKDIFSKEAMQPKMETLKSTTLDQSKLPDTLPPLGSTGQPKMA